MGAVVAFKEAWGDLGAVICGGIFSSERDMGVEGVFEFLG